MSSFDRLITSCSFLPVMGLVLRSGLSFHPDDRGPIVDRDDSLVAVASRVYRKGNHDTWVKRAAHKCVFSFSPSRTVLADSTLAL